jgi:hypothetical protein
MNTKSIIIGLAILAIFLFPFVLALRSSRRNTKKEAKQKSEQQ